MTTEEKIAAAQKKAAAQAPASATTIKQTHYKVLNPWSPANKAIMDEGGVYENFKKSVFNLKETLKEKLQYLTFGKPILVNHEDEEVKSNELVLESNIQETMFASEGDLFDTFRSHVIIEKMGDKVITRLADPAFPNRVLRIAGVPYKAVIWSAFQVDIANYWMKTTYTATEITNDVYTGENFDSKEPTKIKKLNKTIADDKLKVNAKMTNQFGFLPVEEITFKPTRDYSWVKMNEKALAFRLEPKQKMLDEATFALRRELYINHSKQLIDADLVDDLSESQIRSLAEKGILAVLNDSGNHDGTNKAIEVIMGDPKVTSYWENINNIISLAIQDLKLSELGESDSTGTATEAIFNKGNDVETVNTISTYRQKSIARIMEKIRLMKADKPTAVSEVDLDTSKWGIQIVPNVIMNEAKLTDIVIAQLGAGIINMVQAKVKLENISKEAAEASLSEEEKFLNPSLNVMNSFDENGEGRGEPTGDPKQSNTPDPEVTKAKK